MGSDLAGYNCTTRIEKNKRKARKKRKTSSNPPKNCVVYECHFCAHRNLKRGTPIGYMKDLYPAKPTGKSEQLDTLVTSIVKEKVDPTESAMQKPEHLHTFVASIDKARVDVIESATQKYEQFDASVGSTDKDKTDVIVSSEIVGDDPMSGPATPLSTVAVTSLLDSKRRKRYRTGSKKKVEPPDGSSTDVEKTLATSSKRKNKSWTSLKEIAESQSSNSRKFSNISVPFIL